MLRRLIRAGGSRLAAADPDDLAELIALEGALRSAIQTAVLGLRASGATWQEIGTACGVTRQAAQMRWGKLGGHLHNTDCHCTPTPHCLCLEGAHRRTDTARVLRADR